MRQPRDEPIVTELDVSWSRAGTNELVETCDLCGSAAYRLLLGGVNDRLHRLPGEFNLIRCSGCSLVRLSPRPDAGSIPAYYPGEYHAFRVAPPAGVPDRPLAHIRDAVRDAVLRGYGYETPQRGRSTRLNPSRLPGWIERRAMYDYPGFPPWVPGGRALDIGCGNGRFLDRIRRHGWDVVGVDTSAAAAAAAAESFGITVHVGPVEEAPIEERSLDFVHMSHVLEHLPQPVTTLRRVAGLLRPGGRLYVETPNIESLGFRWAGQYWFALDAPRHLWLFGPVTLPRALVQCGFSVHHLSAIGIATFAWEATYRREEREGRMLSTRPSIDWRDRPRAAALAALTAAATNLSPRFGDVLSCWAQLAAPADAPSQFDLRT